MEDLKAEEQKQLISAYQKVFMGQSTPQEGQLVFWDLINRSYVFRPFNQQNAGAYAMEGKRELGLHIMSQVNFMPNHGGITAAQLMASLKESADSAAKLRGTAGNHKQSRKE